MKLSQYVTDPCGLLSIPWWKHREIRLPPHIKILHQRDYTPDAAEGYRDQVYFRLLHDLKSVPEVPSDEFRIKSISPDDADRIASIINRSYPDIRVSEARIRAMADSTAFCPELWIAVCDPHDNTPLGCAMADFHRESGEMSIEWVQVLPLFRRRGIGRILVSELLRRAPEGARFATVSGQVASNSHPEALYRRCGFTGNDYWHILTKEN